MKMPEEPKTPELEKLNSIYRYHQKIGEFLEWIREKYSAEFYSHRKSTEVSTDMFGHPYIDPGTGEERTYQATRLMSIGKKTEVLLAEFFELDLDRVEQERRVLLKHLRECSDLRDAREQKTTVTIVKV